MVVAMENIKTATTREIVEEKDVYSMDANKMIPCDKFHCKEYEVTCTSCKTTGCACNPVCAKCKYYKNTCNGSGEYWFGTSKK